MKCVIDYSVWVSAVLPNETAHTSSAKFLRAIQNAKSEVFCPNFTLIECAAAIARRTNNASQASGLVALIKQFPGIKVVETSSELVNQAILIVQERKLRAGDAIHLAASQIFKAQLVTLDEELMDKSGLVNKVVKPENWLAAN